MYKLEGQIRFSECDTTKSITLPGIINYFQDCSSAQSEQIGHGIDYLKEKKKAWILSSWQIIVERYPKLGEEIEISTWATDFKGLYAMRNFSMKTKSGEMLAYANSVWVFMDLAVGRPAKPGTEEVEAYGMEPPLKMEYAPRKIKLPEKAILVDTFPVRKYHIDTNNHVNNCQYVQMALEVLREDMRIRQVRVEYKKSAVYGDVILPKIAEETRRTVVELCDMGERPYAVVEFVGEKK